MYLLLRRMLSNLVTSAKWLEVEKGYASASCLYYYITSRMIFLGEGTWIGGKWLWFCVKSKGNNVILIYWLYLLFCLLLCFQCPSGFISLFINYLATAPVPLWCCVLMVYRIPVSPTAGKGSFLWPKELTYE